MNFVYRLKQGYGYELTDYLDYLINNSIISNETYSFVVDKITTYENSYFILKLMGDDTIQLIKTEEDEDDE